MTELEMAAVKFKSLAEQIKLFEDRVYSLEEEVNNLRGRLTPLYEARRVAKTELFRVITEGK